MALLKVICWAIIFIVRICFPPGKSLATILNYNNDDNNNLSDNLIQLVQWRSRNPKMRVRIPLKTTNFLLFSAVSD